MPCPIATVPSAPGKHKDPRKSLGTDTHRRAREARLSDPCRTSHGGQWGQAFPLARDRSGPSPDSSLPQHLRDELIAGRPRPQTRSACGRAQSRGLPGSSGLRERRRELEAAGARVPWRPTPGAGSCAVTIGLPELAATVRPSSLRPRPPYRLRGQICGAQAHSGSAARPPQSCELGPQLGRPASRPGTMATVPRPQGPGCGPSSRARRLLCTRRACASEGPTKHSPGVALRNRTLSLAFCLFVLFWGFLGPVMVPGVGFIL